MNVLIVTPTPTHPADQGNRVRVGQLASSFKLGGSSVEVLYYGIDGVSRQSLNEMAEAWDALYVVGPGDFVAKQRWPGLWSIDDWVSPNLVSAVQTLRRTVRYDIVIVNYVWCSLVLDIFRDTPAVRVLDTHDVFGDRHLKARAAGLPASWFYTTVSEERLGVSRADIVLAIQGEEGRYFRALTDGEVRDVEYASPPHFLPIRLTGKVNFGYIGSANPWNIASVKAFDLRLYERRHELPGAMDVSVFGGVTRVIGQLKMLRNGGAVERPVDAYGQVDVLLNPMLEGTGLKIKTVEALSFGRPIIGTRASSAGLEWLPGELVAPDLDGIIDRMIAFVAEPNTLIRVTTEVRDLYMEFYHATSGRLSDLYAACEALSLRRVSESEAPDSSRSPVREEFGGVVS